MISAETCIGVLIPTYNRKSLLQVALESVCVQSVTTIEIIVVDNGSTDGTDRYMAEITDPRVRYIVNEQNIGLIGSINKGIRLFSDKVLWCTILGDDDLLDSRFLEAMLECISDHKARAIVQGHRVFIDGVGNRTRDAVCAPEAQTALEYLRSRSRFSQESYLTGVVFSRQGFEEIGGYPAFATGMASDDAIIFALALRDRLYTCREAVAAVRVHAGAESHDVTRAVEHIEAFREFIAYVDAAAGSGVRFSSGEREQVHRMVWRYARHHIEGLIARCACSVTKGDEARLGPLFRQLSALAASGKYPISFRSRLGFLLLLRFGLNPERFRYYRRLWDHIADFRARRLAW